MKRNLPDYYRKPHRLPDFDYSSPGGYFVSINTKDREPFLSETNGDELQLTPFGSIVYEIWKLLPSRYPYLRLDKIAIMPDHVHALLWIVGPESKNHVVRVVHEPPLPTDSQYNLALQNERRRMTIPKVIGYWKMNSAKRINCLRDSIGASVWQRDYYDEIIRDETHLFAVRKYLDLNATNLLVEP